MQFRTLLFYLASAGAAAALPQSLLPAEPQLADIQRSIQSGDLRRARAGLEQALSTEPADPRIYNLLGVVEAQSNHFKAAEANFQKAIQLASGFTGAYLNLGRLYQEHPNEPRAQQMALETYQKLLGVEPANVEALYQTARLLHVRRQYSASLAQLARLPPDLQERSAALALQCANHAALGKVAETEAAGARLLRSRDLAEADVAPIVPVLGAHNARELAIRLLEELARRGFASSQALRQLGALHENQGHFQQARAVLEKILELEPPSAGLLYRLAQVAYRAGDLDGALGYLGHARDLEPRNAAVHFFFGMLCVERKLPPEARKSLEEAVRLDPANPDYHYALGAVLIHAKDPDAAISHFQKYREARPGDPRGRFALGVAYFDALQSDTARNEFSSVAERPETRMGAQLYLGRLALRENRLAEALVHFQKAIQANPSVPEAYADLALVYIRRNEYALAGQKLAEALKLAPDHYQSNLNLLMLYRRTKDARAQAQATRVEQLQKAGEEKERLLLRSLELRPR